MLESDRLGIHVLPAYSQADRIYVRYKLRSVSFLHPQFVPDKALTILVFLVVLATTSLTCLVNESDRSNVTLRNFGVVFTLILFPSI